MLAPFIPTLTELRRECAHCLLKHARDVGTAGKGIPVHLELDRAEYPAKVTTTAEAIWALAGLPAKMRAHGPVSGFNSIDDALFKLWTGLEELKKDSQQKGETANPRHLAWCLLAATSWQRHKSGGTEIVRAALEQLLALPRSDGLWADDPERDHEIYATWLCTWSIIQAYSFLADASGNPAALELSEKAREVARQSLEKLRELASTPGFRGYAFSVREDSNRQPSELQPNPAMTAYVLSLLGEAQHILKTGDLLGGMETIVDTLVSDSGEKATAIWDSYREPQRPGSKDTDFEHFTTCWVARALWLALSTKGQVTIDQRKTWFRALSRAMKGLLADLYVGPNTGLFYVDVGAPRDFSFAVSDALGLLNGLGNWQIHFEGDEDSKLLKLVQLGQIEEDFDYASREKETFERYSGLRAMISSLDSELTVKRRELAELATNSTQVFAQLQAKEAELEHRQQEERKRLAELKAEVAVRETEVTSIEGRLSRSGLWLRQPLTRYDIIAATAALLGAAMVGVVARVHPITGGIAALVGVAGFAFLAGRTFREALRYGRGLRLGPTWLAGVFISAGALLHFRFFEFVLPDLNRFFELVLPGFNASDLFQLLFVVPWLAFGLGWKVESRLSTIISQCDVMDQEK